jgi:microcystin-dependent protein
MADSFVAEIRIFPFNFPPRNWAFCDGQILPISQNTALFSLLGTTYGGDGKSNFALPNLQGSVPMHPGQGNGLSPRDLGETGGSNTVTLLVSEIPSHTHAVQVSGQSGEVRTGAGNSIAISTGSTVYASGVPTTSMSPNQMAGSGGNQAHNNLQPYLACYFNISLTGIFPPRG